MDKSEKFFIGMESLFALLVPFSVFYMMKTGFLNRFEWFVLIFCSILSFSFYYFSKVIKRYREERKIKTINLNKFRFLFIIFIVYLIVMFPSFKLYPLLTMSFSLNLIFLSFFVYLWECLRNRTFPD
ncbi:hypothetical protein KKH36_02905 [Patescibacteria group bacterium]|nr:hypothetical protein [Patescibacteria group bacterium]